MVPVSVTTGSWTVVQVLGSQERVVVESLDAEQAPVGGEADLPQRGQIT